MARVTNAAITYDDANYMITNEGFTRIAGSTITGLQCMTKSDITSYMSVNEDAISGYASNRLVPYHLLESGIGFADGNILYTVYQDGYSYDITGKGLTEIYRGLAAGYIASHTSTKLWGNSDFGNDGTQLYEYDITLDPFTYTFNRQIDLTLAYQEILSATTAASNTTIIGVNTNNVLYSFNITSTTAVKSTLHTFSLGTNVEITGLNLTTSNKLIMVGKAEVLGSDVAMIWQINYSTFAVELALPIETINYSEILGIYSYSGSMYYLTDDDTTYKINTTSPYSNSLYDTHASTTYGTTSQIATTSTLSFTGTTTAPTVPSNLEFTLSGEVPADQNWAFLSWNASTDSLGVHHYNIYQDDVLFAQEADYLYHVVDYNVPSSGGPTGCWTVSAVNNAGIESAKETPCIEWLTEPAQVTGLTVINEEPAFPQLEISWNYNAAGDNVTNYQLLRSTSAGGTYSLIYTALNNYYTDTSLNATTTYYYKVNAVNAAGTGPYSTIVFETTGGGGGK